MTSQSLATASPAAELPLTTRLLRLLQKRRSWFIGYLFILPWLVSLVLFDVIPFGMNLYLGTTSYSVGPVASAQFTGFANYERMFTQDDLFGKSLLNTLWYLAASVPLTVTLAFIIALLLNTNVRGVGIFRTIYYIPSVVPIVASSVIFLWMFNARFGAINQLLLAFGLTPVRWLSSPDWVKPAMVIVSLWGFGAQMIIFLAALQSIPEHLYEAVAIDGGGLWRRLRHVTIPLMTPTIFFNLLIGLISGFQVFTIAYIMLGPNGGPLQSGLFYMMHTYNNAFRYFNMGYASALSLVLFVIIFVFTILMVWTSNRWVYYGDESDM